MRLIRLIVGLLFAGLLLVGAGGARSDELLSIYTWADYFPPALLARFEQETGNSRVGLHF